MRDTPCSNAHPQFYTLKGLDCTATMDCGIILLLLCFLCVEESQGQCSITFVEIVSSNSSDYLNYSQPQFILYGRTVGGEPTFYEWTANGTAISTQNNAFVIERPQLLNSIDRDCPNHMYQSTLTVTGRYPGIYKYVIYAPSSLTSSINIEAPNPPTNLVLRQIGLNTIEASWTAPSSLLSLQYAISTNNQTFVIFTPNTSYNFSNREVGQTLTVQVISLSNHYGSYILGPQSFTVLELLQPTVSTTDITSSTASFSIVEHSDSLPADQYTVILTKTADSRCSVISNVRSETTNTEVVVVNELFEDTVYSVRVDANSSSVGVTKTFLNLYAITTLSSVPSLAPSGLVLSTLTSQSISLRWNDITCEERNGLITSYSIRYGPVGVSRIDINTDIRDNFYTVFGLVPNTAYNFQVAGITINGTGPYSSETGPFTTLENVPGPVSVLAGNATFDTVTLYWSPLQSANYIILQYEIQYIVNGTLNATVSVAADPQQYTIRNLSPSTMISTISIRARSSVGYGDSTIFDITFATLNQPPAISAISLRDQTENSVTAAWEKVPDDLVSQYVIYYSRIGGSGFENAIIVPNSVSTITIMDLNEGSSYRITMIVEYVFAGRILQSDRSPFTSSELFATDVASSSQGSPSTEVISISTTIVAVISGVAVFIITVFIYSVVLLAVVLIRIRRKSKKDVSFMEPVVVSNQTNKKNTNDESDFYEVIPNRYEATNSAFEMTGCAAYGNSSDPGRERRLTPSVSVAGGIYEDYNN